MTGVQTCALPISRWAFESGVEEFLDAIPMRRAGTPEDVGGTAIYLASRAGAYLTGVVIPVSGGVATIDSTGPVFGS